MKLNRPRTANITEERPIERVASPEHSHMSISRNTLWKTRSNIRSSVAIDGVFLVDLDDEFSYGLDALGAQIWITIENSPSGMKFEDILDVLETHFNTPRTQLADDLRLQLHRLHSLGFVEKLYKT